MVIQYLGQGYIKVSLGDQVLAFAPISKKSKHKGAQFGANIALIPVDHDDYNGSEQVTYGNKEPMVLSGPGEYEINGVFIKGIPSEGIDGKINTIYTVLLEDVRLCHLGALAGPLSSEAKELIGDIDILFIPTYGDGLIDEEAANKLASSLSTKIVVPLFGLDAKAVSLNKFYKEAGEDGAKPLDRLTIKRKDLEGKEGEIVPVASF